MRTCDYCGEEIEFRTQSDGQRTPIHVNGNRCPGGRGSPLDISTKPFGSTLSYVNPNARCPVCGERVHFYQSPYGGRVFFDDVGWPWPKHPCTDNPRSQSETFERLNETAHKSFVSNAGEPLDLYSLSMTTEGEGLVLLEFRRIDHRLTVFRIVLTNGQLTANDITVEDLQKAPAFVIRFYETHRVIEFISARKKTVDTLRIERRESVQ